MPRATTRRRPKEPSFGFFTAPFRGRTWRETAHLLIGGLVTSVIGFGYAVSVFFGFGGLAITLIGAPLLGLGILGARGFGVMERALARGLLRVDVGEPEPLRARRAARPERNLLVTALTDATGWRALLYLLVRFPCAVAGGALACAFWGLALYYVTAPLWWHAMPHQSITQFGSYWVDTWPRVLLFAIGGVLLLWITPWILRPFALLESAMVRGLLGPTRESERIRELERSRAHAVDDAATQLRQIERDLHDGAQARLVSLALNLGMAKERLAADQESGPEDTDAQRSLELVDAAHADAKAALTELRDLARGIHPAALDAGLEPALATLAARSVVPVDLRVEMSLRPAPAIETIAYYCAAELLTNVAKHSNARHATLHVVTYGLRLALEVTDDGVGGARAGANSGLTGLAERVRAVDGSVELSSPPGGPTVVTVDLPVTT
jgi:signal transduction histidine kinase